MDRGRSAHGRSSSLATPDRSSICRSTSSRWARPPHGVVILPLPVRSSGRRGRGHRGNGDSHRAYSGLLLLALRGMEAEATALIEATITRASAGGQGFAVTGALWAAAVLYNGLGRHEQALAAAERACSIPSCCMRRCGRCPSWSRRLPAPEAQTSAGMLSSGWPGLRSPPVRTSDWVSRRGPGAAQRGRCRRRPVPGRDRSPEPHPAPFRSRPRASVVWRVAAPPEPPC